ncbi:MAG: FHA domain-containing protein [Lysobacteraceae bacterium]
MRLTFPNGEHPDVADPGRLSVGSGSENRVRIEGLADRHAVIANDRRGLWLVVDSGDAGVHVNARPVSRLALVRPGDVISLGRVQMVLHGDQDPKQSVLPPSTGAFHANSSNDSMVCAARFVLRGVGGTFSGCSFNLCDPLVIGRGSDAQIQLDEPTLAEQHARVELHGDRVVLRDLAGEGTLVNGTRIKDALLNSGDQLAFDQNRFVLEAPGLSAPPTRHDSTPLHSGQVNTQTMSAVTAPLATNPNKPPIHAPVAQSSRAARSAKTVWWLILAAAVLGGLITLLLVYGPRLGG